MTSACSHMKWPTRLGQACMGQGVMGQLWVWGVNERRDLGTKNWLKHRCPDRHHVVSL